MRASKYEAIILFLGLTQSSSPYLSALVYCLVWTSYLHLLLDGMVWYGSNLVSRQKVSRYTNTTNTSCRYTYKDLDCRHTNTLIAVMVCTSVSYAFRIKNGELYPVTKYTKIILCL